MKQLEQEKKLMQPMMPLGSSGRTNKEVQSSNYDETLAKYFNRKKKNEELHIKQSNEIDESVYTFKPRLN